MKAKGFLSLLAVGVLFGLSGPIAKLLSDSFTAYESVFIRFLVAFVLIAIFSFAVRNRVILKNIDRFTLAMFSITFPLSVILFVLSVFNTKVALAIFTYYIADALTSYIIGYFKLNEKLDIYKVSGLFIVILSLIFFSNLPENFAIDIGMVFGILSGVVNGVASYFKKIIKGAASIINLTVLQTFAGVLVAGLAVAMSGNIFVSTINPDDIIIGLIYGLLFLIITYLMIYGFQNFNLNLGSIVVSSELIFGPLFAVLLLGETLTQWEVIGAVFVILGIIVSNMGGIKNYLNPKTRI